MVQQEDNRRLHPSVELAVINSGTRAWASSAGGVTLLVTLSPLTSIMFGL